jgi:hypothetical protein
MKEKVLIKHPCLQNLDDMPRVKGGVFCTVCSEKVEDVTQLSDEELVQWISDNSVKKPCGIYTKDQAKVPLTQRFLFPFRYAAISLASLFVVRQGQSQALIASDDSASIISSHSDSVEKKIVGRVETKKRGKPLPHARVFVANAESTITYVDVRKDGTFECVLPLTATDSTYEVSVTSKGYRTQAFGYVACGEFIVVKMNKKKHHLFRPKRVVRSKF